MSRPRLFSAAALAAIAAALPVRADDIVYDTAVLQGLDKVTAHISTLEAPVGGSVRFGTLEIIPRTCRKKPPEEEPESAAFLDISERREGQPTASLFRGWMFASSPALSAMEHPVYDVWVVNCTGQSVTEISPNPTKADSRKSPLPPSMAPSAPKGAAFNAPVSPPAPLPPGPPPVPPVKPTGQR